MRVPAEARDDFRTHLGERGIDRLITAAYYLLHLITFYTHANDKLQAWQVKSGTLAPHAAGGIHVEAVYAEGKTLTPDQGGSASTTAFCDAVAALLYRYRDGDSNRRSIWLCSRNDAIGNVAVMIAAAGVFASDSHWPDLFVAVIIAALNISAAVHVVRLARTELRGSVAECEPDSPLLTKVRVG